MSVLWSAIGLIRRPYTCMFVQKCVRQVAIKDAVNNYHTTPVMFDTGTKKSFDKVSSLVYDVDTSNQTEAPADEAKLSKPTPQVVKTFQFSDPDLKMGEYFPTKDVFETTYDGVKFTHLPRVHIHATYQNTKAGLHVGKSQTVSVQTGGKVGFKNAKKKTNVCGQTVGFAIGLDMVKKGYTHARVILEGFGAGRLPALKGLQLAGITIVSITDRTYPDVANRPRGMRNR